MSGVEVKSSDSDSIRIQYLADSWIRKMLVIPIKFEYKPYTNDGVAG